MRQYFKAYKYDLETLKKIWDNLPKLGTNIDWSFNIFTTSRKNICSGRLIERFWVRSPTFPLI